MTLSIYFSVSDFTHDFEIEGALEFGGALAELSEDDVTGGANWNFSIVCEHRKSSPGKGWNQFTYNYLELGVLCIPLGKGGSARHRPKVETHQRWRRSRQDWVSTPWRRAQGIDELSRSGTLVLLEWVWYFELLLSTGRRIYF
jgi:hypothetical protein